MKLFLPAILLGFSLVSYRSSFAQPGKRTITGLVTSFEESLPLEGVKVTVKGTAVSSGTQADGIYYITVTSNDSILIFNLPGYQSKEVSLSKSNEYNVVLTAGGSESDLPLNGLTPFSSPFVSRCCR